MSRFVKNEALATTL